MAEAEDYESLPAATPLFVSVTAGAFAGIAEHCVMYPVDSVKTRMQNLSCPKTRALSMYGMFRTMISEEGLFRPIRGMNAMAIGAGPAHAMYFSCLEVGKESASKFKLSPHFADGAAAVMATLLHDAVMTPADVVKQRMQMCCSPYASCTSCVSNVLKFEGLHAFYRSYPTQLTMNIPFQSSLVVTYGVLQRVINPGKAYNPPLHFLCGGMAGAVACAVTMPLDVCKTLLNTQEPGVLKALHCRELNGLFGAAKAVKSITGFRGFFSGLTARMLYQAPSTAVAWTVYEFFKNYLHLSDFEECSKEENDAVLPERRSGFDIVPVGSSVGHVFSQSTTSLEQE